MSALHHNHQHESPLRKASVALVTVLALTLSTACFAIPISGLYTTGVDDLGNHLALGSVDGHYSLTTNFGLAGVDTAYVGSPIPWIANNTNSQWIGPGVNLTGNFPDDPGLRYIYSISFDLTGFDLSTVSLNVAAQADNAGQIFLNGTNTGSSMPNHVPGEAFVLANHTNVINSGFVAGINTLAFHVENFTVGGTNPTGLNVLKLDGTGDLLPQTANGIPEPGALALMGLGFMALRRRRT